MKPISITVVVDTREQLPWIFDVPTIVKCLPAGDYSVLGHETECAIERKSLEDFIGSVTSGRERFWRELEKLAGYRFRSVVIEAELGDITRGDYRSRAVPQSIIASALAITCDFGIPVLWARDATLAARSAQWMLRRFVANQAKTEAA
jgi:DNA excision repair protein ERCC-4